MVERGFVGWINKDRIARHSLSAWVINHIELKCQGQTASAIIDAWGLMGENTRIRREPRGEACQRCFHLIRQCSRVVAIQSSKASLNFLNHFSIINKRLMRESRESSETAVTRVPLPVSRFSSRSVSKHKGGANVSRLSLRENYYH